MSQRKMTNHKDVSTLFGVENPTAYVKTKKYQNNANPKDSKIKNARRSCQKLQSS